MSIQWPYTHVNPHVFASLSPHQPPSPALKRAAKRYVIAMNELNKQICDYNAEALQCQLAGCRTHIEMRQLLLQSAQVPFVAVNINTVAAHTPRLVVLDRAAQCVNLLREVLDEWEGDAALAPATASATASATAAPAPSNAADEPPAAATFSVFSAWTPSQSTSLV